MSIGKKLEDHFVNNTLETLKAGTHSGAKLGKEIAGENGEFVGMIVGLFGSAVLAGVRLMSPGDAIQTAMRSDQEIDRRRAEITRDF